MKHRVIFGCLALAVATASALADDRQDGDQDDQRNVHTATPIKHLVQLDGSFDTIAGPIDNMFDFSRRDDGPRRLILDETTGAIVSAPAADDDDR